MKIQFGLGLDGDVWPDGLTNKKAILGEITVGELGLLQILETHTGLRAPEVRPFSRLLAFHRVLQKSLSPKSFFASSFATDPLAVTRDLLNFRNDLKMSGWDGSPIEKLPRITELSAIEKNNIASLHETSDRLIAIGVALEKKKTFPIQEIVVIDPLVEIPQLWQKTFQLLGKVGVRITVTKPQSETTFSLQEKSPFRVLQCRDPWSSAQWLAAYLSQRTEKELSETIIVAPPRNAEILANALRSRNIPFGASTGESSLCRPAVQIVQIGILLAFAPKNPHAAKALLLQNDSPVWRKLGRRLLSALDQMPAIGSEEWIKAIDYVLQDWAKLPDNKITKDIVDERLNWTFGLSNSDRKKGIILNEIEESLAPLIKWLNNFGRMKEKTSYLEAGALLQEFIASLRLLAKNNSQRFTEDELIRLFKEVAGAGVGAQVEPGRAGGPIILSGPEKILDTAQNVIWWDFTVGATKSTHTRYWLPRESLALEKAGILLRSSGQTNAFVQSQWLRPIRLAQKSFLAVSFGVDSNGESEFTHPILDYLLPQDKKTRASILSKIRIDPTKSNSPSNAFKKECNVTMLTQDVLPWPYQVEPSPNWNIPMGSVEKRERNSPSSLQKLLGCSFAYALDYGAGLDFAWSAGLDEGPLLDGKVAHAIFQRVFKKGKPPSLDKISDLTSQTWNDLIPVYAQTLLLDENQMVKQRLYQTVLSAAQEYARFLFENDLEIIGSEDVVTGSLSGDITISGRIDQLLGKNNIPTLIMDFKLGGAADRKAELKNGDALQLAVYASVASTSKTPLDIGYFIINDRQAIMLGDSYKSALVVNGPSVSEMLLKTSKDINEAFKKLNSGIVQAPGVSDELVKDSEWDVPCGYCAYDGICGRRWANVKKSNWSPR